MLNFREAEHKLCIVSNHMAVLAIDPEHKTQANAALCYGYVDHQMGLTYETLGLLRCDEEDYALVLAAPTICMKLRADSVEAETVRPINDEALMAQFADRISSLDIYYRNKAVAATREREELDLFRHPQYPDDVQALFLTPKGQLEKMWVRLEAVLPAGHGIYFYFGKLLNHPNRIPKLRIGDVVTIIILKSETGCQCVGVPGVLGQ